jgi:hypothetical protein
LAIIYSFPHLLNVGGVKKNIMKKTLKNILIERTDTIEYRAIRKQLMIVAQNGGNTFHRIAISDKTITQLQNELLTVEKVNEHGYEKYKISW